MTIATHEHESAAAPAADDADANGAGRRPFPVLRTVPIGAPFGWLAKGLAGFRACPLPCLFYGVCFALMGWIQASLLRDSPTLMMALTFGFLLVGPFFAMGLYEVARRRECGERCNLGRTTVAWSRNVSNIAIFGIGLGVLTMLWARSSMMLIAIFFPRQMPDMGLLLAHLTSADNIAFVATYVGVGAVFASLVFAFAAIAVPLMLDREIDAITAMIASVVAVGRNLPAMLLWAALIVLLTAVGFASLFVGLIVTVPWLGLATWHSYRDLVEPVDAAPAPPHDAAPVV
ncbi:MAG: DUF2189 domain-containing protein [Lautropia sp.]